MIGLSILTIFGTTLTAATAKGGGALSERTVLTVGTLVHGTQKTGGQAHNVRSESASCDTLEACQATVRRLDHLASKRLKLASRFERQRNGLRRVVRARAQRSVFFGLLCIHHYEGAWNAHNAPYSGGLQMDGGFQSTYGRTLLQRYGPAGNWPPEAQLAVGIVAFYSGRGYGPWPNTRRMCGI